MEFLVPKLSATMERARVVRWLKKVGDRVAMGEPLVELETDKATMEVESPVEATLEAVLAEEGAELPIGAALARLATMPSARTARLRPATQADSEPARTAGLRPAPQTGSEPAPAQQAGWKPALPGASGEQTRVLASPLARRLARDNGIELSGLSGVGARRLRKRDVLAAVEARGVGARERDERGALGFELLSPMRAQIAAAVTLSRRTIPSFVLDRWVETTALERARAALAPEIERATGLRPTLTDFLLSALAGSLASHPKLLDRWVEEGGRAGRIRMATIDVGLVVALPEGMMIPVLHDLGAMTPSEIVRARRAAVERARRGRLLQSDAAPVALSLSNLGRTGADRFEAIINPGQSGILAVGSMHERVISRSGAVAAALGVNLTLTLDHRLVDGIAGAEFLATLAERIEQGN